MKTSRLLAALAAIVLPLAARAQAPTAGPDSLPFHAGQWGTEFVAGGQFVGIGALYFHSSHSAWTADVSAGTSRLRSTGTFGQRESSSSGGLRVGHRWYRSLGRGVAAYFGGGLSGTGTRTTTQLAFGQEIRDSRRSLGAFGALGGAYFVTPHLSLGGGVGLDAGWDHLTSSRPIDSAGNLERSTATGYFASLGSSQLFAALYF